MPKNICTVLPLQAPEFAGKTFPVDLNCNVTECAYLESSDDGFRSYSSEIMFSVIDKGWSLSEKLECNSPNKGNPSEILSSVTIGV